MTKKKDPAPAPVTAIGAAERPQAKAQPVRTPLNYISKRHRKLDFGPVTGPTRPAPTPRFGAVEPEADESE